MFKIYFEISLLIIEIKLMILNNRTYSLLICMRILLHERKVISAQEIRFLFVGGTRSIPPEENPHAFLLDKQYSHLL
mgnify:CR=1 FL=1